MSGIQDSTTGRLRLVLAALVGIIVIGVGLMAVSNSSPESDPAGTARIDPARFGERILLIAPHPDDEVIAPGGLTVEALASGARVRAIVLTCGDGFKKAAALGSFGRTDPAAYIALGNTRHRECDDALARIGVPGEDRVFLGYPDTGLRSLWEFDWDTDRPHLARNGATEVPYPFAFRPGAPYCGASVAEDLEHLIADYQPTSIVYPDPNDRHPDHRAGAAFVEYALRDLGYECRRFTYLAHYGHYPLPWAYLPKQSLRPPADLAETGTSWLSLPLPSNAESEKLAAILMYRSQVRLPHMNVYLRSFVRRNELFGTYTPLHPLRIQNDTEPPSSLAAQDVVVREPAAPSVPEILRRGGVPSGVRMAIGPTTLWVGVTVPGAGPARTSVAIHLRLLGGRAAARFDALVSGETAEVSHAYSESVRPASVVVRRTGDTVWVGVPATVVEGHDAVLVSGEAVLPGGTTAGTSWRPVLLR